MLPTLCSRARIVRSMFLCEPGIEGWSTSCHHRDKHTEQYSAHIRVVKGGLAALRVLGRLAARPFVVQKCSRVVGGGEVLILCALLAVVFFLERRERQRQRESHHTHTHTQQSVLEAHWAQRSTAKVLRPDQEEPLFAVALVRGLRYVCVRVNEKGGWHCRNPVQDKFKPGCSGRHHGPAGT